MKTILNLLIILLVTVGVVGQQQSDTLQILEGEQWYGATVDDGYKAPFKTEYSLNLYGNCKGNQAVPLLLSSKGRFIWSDQPFSFSFEKQLLIVKGSVEIGDGGKSLASAYRAASSRFFPASGKTPELMFIDRPQYNTWIELQYNQSQEGILKYARDIIANGFPPGVLMIDDNWFPGYGDFTFRRDRFSDPAAMINELHKLGFRVMMWVSPFISPDTEAFRLLRDKGYLLNVRAAGDSTQLKPFIVEWWNGFSASLDLSKPGAVRWLQDKLNGLQNDFGVDGFKFDAGDPEYYMAKDLVVEKSISPNDFTSLWGQLGAVYPFNEFRAMWKMGNQPLIMRLRDKQHTWTDLQKIIPQITTAGLLGYSFSCPDMIGGGEISSFTGNSTLNERLIVRSAQVHALMPMMQFSVAPWRVLTKENFDAVKQALNIRNQYLPTIKSLADSSAKTGEPIVRNMEYEFPNQGFANCSDQFMLGTSILVAPVVTQSDDRTVMLPKGRWKSYDGKIIRGPSILKIHVPIDVIPWFERIK